MTVVTDLTFAVEFGMILAALTFIRKVSRTTTVTRVTRDYVADSRVHVLQGKDIPDYAVVYRVHGPFLFGATDKFADILEELDTLPPIVILRLRNMTAIDATGLGAIRELADRIEGFRLGAVDFISKPFQRDEMLARVHTHVELSRLRLHLEERVALRTAQLRESEELFRTMANAAPVMIGHYQQNTLPNLTVVAPDTGGAERARAYAKRLNAELALCDKRREKANVAEVMNVVGDVRGRSCLIVDDMCDTGGSLTKVSLALKQAGAARVDACFTHPVLSGRAAQHLGNSGIEQIVVTNTIPLNAKAAELKNIKVLSIAPLLAKAIKSIHEETSVSSLFV